MQYKDLFAQLNHGLNPENASYQYIVVPDKSINAFRDLAEQIDLYIAQNDGSVQAIREGNKYGFVFYKSASTKMDDGLVISSDKPSIVFIEKKGNTYTIAVSVGTVLYHCHNRKQHGWSL